MRYLPRLFSFTTLFSLIGAALILVGCDERDAATIKAAADAGATSLNPLTAGVSTIISVIAAHFIAKANDGVADRKDYTPDDIRAMAAGLEAEGYSIQRKPS